MHPTYSLWLLADNLLTDPQDSDYLHDYQLRDKQGRKFISHGGIWLVELNKFVSATIETEQQRWLKFFQTGEQLDDEQLPIWMQTDEMKQAMNTLRMFSEKEREYDAYQARQNYLREQQSVQAELEEYQRELAILRQATEAERQAKEEERMAKEMERQAKEAERMAKEAALAEIERLKALLAVKENH